MTTTDELGYKLAVAFADSIIRDVRDESGNSLLWKISLLTESNTAIQEWTLVHLFLTTKILHREFKNKKIAESLLDFYYGYSLRGLIENGILSDSSEIEKLLQQRFQEYYDAMGKSRDFAHQLLRVAEVFLIHCRQFDEQALLAMTGYFMDIAIADSKLAVELQQNPIEIEAV